MQSCKIILMPMRLFIIISFAVLASKILKLNANNLLLLFLNLQF